MSPYYLALLASLALLIIVWYLRTDTLYVHQPSTILHGVPLEQHHIYHGHSLPLAHEDRPVGHMESQSSGRDMVALDKFLVSPHCCPSAYSTDQGCVCLSAASK